MWTSNRPFETFLTFMIRQGEKYGCIHNIAFSFYCTNPFLNFLYVPAKKHLQYIFTKCQQIFTISQLVFLMRIRNSEQNQTTQVHQTSMFCNDRPQTVFIPNIFSTTIAPSARTHRTQQSSTLCLVGAYMCVLPRRWRIPGLQEH